MLDDIDKIREANRLLAERLDRLEAASKKSQPR
jgi:ubiquinone biosynthesis protein UbiJ